MAHALIIAIGLALVLGLAVLLLLAGLAMAERAAAYLGRIGGSRSSSRLPELEPLPRPIDRLPSAALEALRREAPPVVKRQARGGTWRIVQDAGGTYLATNLATGETYRSDRGVQWRTPDGRRAPFRLEGRLEAVILAEKYPL